MSTTPDTAQPAQQAFTDAQLQAAIDAAFSTVSLPYSWSARLAIARAFLARLEEYAKPADAQENWNQYAKKAGEVGVDCGEIHPDDLALIPEEPAWTLPPPPEGHKWHRDDWTQDMLPEGYRPLLDGELIENSDEVWQFAEGPWKNESIAVGLTVSSRNHHFRTSRPLPSWAKASAELIQKAEASGVDLDAQPEEPEWKPHDGGPCPLKDEEVEEWEVKWTGGVCSYCTQFKPSTLDWDKGIIAYRVLKCKPGHGPEAKAKPKLPIATLAQDQVDLAPEAQAAVEKAFTEEVFGKPYQPAQAQAAPTEAAEKPWMSEARQIAAQCWCDTETSSIQMDARLAEAVAKRIQAWMETAAQNQRGVDYYRSLVVRCGEAIGEQAYIADDGGKHEDVLCAKVPELVEALVAKRQEGQPWTPSPGDVVRLKSGGPEMTVLAVNEGAATVIWAPNNEKIEAADIPSFCLEPASKK